MSLSCECGEWEGEGWTYYQAEDFSKLQTSKRKRCCSCKELISIGLDCLVFERFRYPITYVETKIVGEGMDVPMANWYMCEKCGEQYLNLSALGYCIDISENMLVLLKEYQKLHGFIPEENK